MADKNRILQNMKAGDFESIFEGIMKFSKDGLFVTDHEGTILMVNRATEKMVDFKASDILGRNAREVAADGYYSKSVAIEVIEKGRPVSMIQYSRNGKKILATGIPIHNADGELRFVLVNDRDISSLEHLSEVLEQEMAGPELRYEFSDLGLAATELQDVLVKSSAMHSVIKTAVRAARYDLTLVITGDSGVGKSMIARAIHRISERRNGQFVEVNCGAISDSLLESELFGHEKGAFTGAAPTGKKGLFEIAHGGTLFLDEVGEIPLHLQVKLLRFLEGGGIVRVGGLKTIEINTRVIAATNRDLDTMVREGTFRSDLYYRLNVVSLHIPPLRERKEEIAPLIDHFLDRFNKDFKTDKSLSRAARNALLACPFPGNIRELENLIRRLVAMTEDEVIKLRHLPDKYRRGIELHNDAEPRTQDHFESVKLFERQALEEAVKIHGSQRKAARALGISQSVISKKLQQK